MEDDSKLQKKYNAIIPHLNEKQKRIFLSAESDYYGYGGISKVSKLSGVSRVTITKGIHEISDKTLSDDRTRKREAGEKKKLTNIPKYGQN